MLLVFSLILLAALVAEDQLIKLFIIQNVAEGRGGANYYTFSIGDFNVFSITHIRNDGAGWSILGGQTVFLAVFTVIVLLGLLAYMILKRHSLNRFEMLSLSLIIGGGLGNLIDRFRMLIEGTDKFSGVVDYIKLRFIDFPVFNFADCCVVIGAILFCVLMLFSEIKSSREKKSAKTEAHGDESV